MHDRLRTVIRFLAPVVLASALAFVATPAADSDLDGIDDAQDTCPDVANPMQIPQVIAPTTVGTGPTFTSDGSRVVVARTSNLWVATVDGSAAAVNIVSLAAGREIREFLISPDDSWVVFRADADVLDEFHLYKVPIDGSASTRIDTGLTEPHFFLFTTDGSEVVFFANDPALPGVTQVYRVPIAGGTPHRIDTWTTLGIQPNAWLKLVDGGPRLLAVEKVAGNPVDRVISIDLTDESAVVLGEGPLINGYSDFRATADGAQVVVQTTGSGGDQLFAVPVAGGTEAPLNGPGESVDGWALTPVPVGGEFRAVWSARNVGLFSAPIDGSELLPLSNDDPSSPSFQVSPDGTHVAYTFGSLTSVPVTGGDAQMLSSYAEGMQAAPNGSRIFFDNANYSVFPERRALWSVPFDGSTSPLRHDPAFNSGVGVREYHPSPTSDGVLYLVDDDLYWSPADRTGWIQLSTLGSVRPWTFEMATDGRRVVYEDGGMLMSRAVEPDLDADGVVETCDCNDLTPGQDPPAAAVDALGLEPDAGGTRLSWTRPDDADPGDAYTVLRSSAASEYAAGGAIECLVDRIDSDAAVDSDTPSPGAAFYYVIRVDNGCGAGPLEPGRPAGEAAVCSME